MHSDADEFDQLPREELVERARALHTVLRVAEAVANASDVTDLSQRFVDAIVQYARYPSVCLFRYRPSARAFELLAQRGFDLAHFAVAGTRLPADGSLTGIAAARRAIVTTSDVAKDERIEPETRAALTRDGFGSGVSVPIIHQGVVIGAYNLIYPEGTTFGPQERGLLEALARTVGVAIAQRLAVDAQRELEVQARRAQQLESLGVLAGGIAHDFNNLLTAILGNVELAQVLVAREERADIEELLVDARSAIDRTRGLVGQLLTFARGGAPVKQATSKLADLVREAATFVLRGTSVRFDFDAAADLGTVEIDAGQIAQVVQNLVLNAAQASPSGADVHVRITRRRVAIAEPPLSAGSWVRLEVEDHGHGIPPEQLGRIFEPFVTMRPHGTGLGLAVTQSIVHRHGGALTVRSEVGRGTTFTVDLPAGTATASLAPPAADRLTPLGGRVLLMDDDESVRRVATLLLGKLGFEVTSVRDGTAALDAAARAAAEERPFRVAVLDLTVIGGRGGAEIAPELRRLHPGMRLVVSSGYSRDPSALDRHALGWNGLLNKPYSLRALEKVLTAALA